MKVIDQFPKQNIYKQESTEFSAHKPQITTGNELEDFKIVFVSNALSTR